MYAILYGNIYHQYTPFMLAYIPAPWILWVLFCEKYLQIPSGYVKIAIEHGPIEIVDFPINSMVIFQ